MKARRPEPAEIEYKNMRFLITDRPTDATLDKYIEVYPRIVFECPFSGNLYWLFRMHSQIMVASKDAAFI